MRIKLTHTPRNIFANRHTKIVIEFFLTLITSFIRTLLFFSYRLFFSNKLSLSKIIKKERVFSLKMRGKFLRLFGNVLSFTVKLPTDI